MHFTPTFVTLAIFLALPGALSAPLGRREPIECAAGETCVSAPRPSCAPGDAFCNLFSHVSEAKRHTQAGRPLAVDGSPSLVDISPEDKREFICGGPDCDTQPPKPPCAPGDNICELARTGDKRQLSNQEVAKLLGVNSALSGRAPILCNGPSCVSRPPPPPCAPGDVFCEKFSQVSEAKRQLHPSASILEESLFGSTGSEHARNLDPVCPTGDLRCQVFQQAGSSGQLRSVMADKRAPNLLPCAPGDLECQVLQQEGFKRQLASAGPLRPCIVDGSLKACKV
ncbi:hypothetical protein PLICRDRAFT_50787 [Plicaturopsis crispa FD-325 SS-3]|nr:hypothetical protein PLICRDRAFT_50787 [Plicaturopsis crispa FD-325 SS-3]